MPVAQVVGAESVMISRDSVPVCHSGMYPTAS